MTQFVIDKHQQLRIKAGFDIKAAPDEPDLLVLSQEQTSMLADIIFNAVAESKITAPSVNIHTLATKQRRK